jgi:flagellar biosynthesis chaperone FliJ
LECPVCNERNFIDGHSITKTEYIDLLISEVSKQSKAYIKCSNEIEVLEEKYNNNNVKHKKFQDNYNKMTEYIAMNTINNNKLSFV